MNLELLQKGTMTSLEIAEITGKEHKNILADIRDEIRKLGEERAGLIFQLSEYKDTTGRTLPMFVANIQGILQLGARYSADVRFKLIEKITKKETIENSQPNIKELTLRESELYFKYASAFNNEKYRETMLVLGANKLNGSEILPLPEITKKSYSAAELSQIIMNKCGIQISAKRIGKITNDNNLKSEKYGYWAYDKSKYSNKQVESFRYYENAINEILKYI